MTSSNNTGSSQNPNEQPFTQGEIEQFLADGRGADFLLELQVARLMDSADFKVELSGRYDDPVSGKVREFDVRAHRTDPWRGTTIWLSLECKNIPVHSPLLVMSSERVSGEEKFEKAVYDDTPTPTSMTTMYNIVQVRSLFYNKIHYYGRAMVRLQRDRGSASISTAQKPSTELHSKWEQAVSSLAEKVILVGKGHAQISKEHHFYPCIVVPNNTLWEVRYNADGSVKDNPTKRDFVYQHIWKECAFSKRPTQQSLRLSKLHVFTVKGLNEFLVTVERLFTHVSKPQP